MGDFGVSALISAPPASERIGTITYHAPEVQSSLNYSVKSDVWAIGVIMWETMQLRPPGGEPVSPGMLNFTPILQIYGQPARELLLQHLSAHPDQRPQAGAIKESMLQLLKDSTRHTVVSRAYQSSATAQSDAARQADWMRPRSVQVPSTLADSYESLPQQNEQDQSESVSGRFQSDSVSDLSSVLSKSGDSVPSTDRSNAPTFSAVQPETAVEAHDSAGQAPLDVLELSAELGIYVAAGVGGEFGAWKIASLPADKPAAKSNAVSVGEYLWEINGKVIFGMPFQLICSLVKGTNPEVRMGVKTGLGLSIRNAIIRRDGDYNQYEAVRIGAIAISNPGKEVAVGKSASSLDIVDKIENSGEQSLGLLPVTSSLITSETRASPTHSQNDAGDGGDETKDEPSADGIPMQVQKVAALRSGAPPPVVNSPPQPTPPSAETVPITASIASNSANDNGDDGLEPQGIRGINSPIVQSPETVPCPPGAGHMPPDISTATAEQSPSSQADASAVNAATHAMQTMHGTATIAGDGQYSGELRDGKPFGMGTATWPHQGHTYVGEWRNGVMHGQGTATYLNGDRYDGEWAIGKRSGLGRYAHGSGDIYEGLWSNERKHGLGVDSFADGRGYRGEFIENKFAGIGTYFTDDGAVYQVTV